MWQSSKKKYKTISDWVGTVIHLELLSKLKFDYTTKWYVYKPKIFILKLVLGMPFSILRGQCLWDYIVIFQIQYLPNPSTRAGYDTRSVFMRSLTGLNSEFSFS